MKGRYKDYIESDVKQSVWWFERYFYDHQNRPIRRLVSEGFSSRRALLSAKRNKRITWENG